jgi:hypothetical protein
MEKKIKYYNLKNDDDSHEFWYMLKEDEKLIDDKWHEIPFSFIEKWFNIVSAKIALGNKTDEYSQIVDEICKSCIKKEKVSIKQFKCVVNYAAYCIKQNKLKYKYKNTFE